MSSKIFLAVAVLALTTACKTGGDETGGGHKDLTALEKTQLDEIESEILALDGHSLNEIAFLIADRISEGGSGKATLRMARLKKDIQLSCGGDGLCTLKRN